MPYNNTDKDIIPGAETLSPVYIIFENYEKMELNRSLICFSSIL